MAFPTITVQIAFASDPLATTPTWTDVSSYVESFRIKRGREDETGRIEAGTAEIVLRNADRRFDPTYTSGPYYPNVLPAKRVNIRAFWSPFIYDIFTGYVEAWPINWPLLNDSNVALRCVDGFKLLAAPQIAMFHAEQLSGAEISSALNAPFQWPNSTADLDTGITTIAAINATMSPLARIQEICEAEQGQFFIGAAGLATFHDRHHRLLDSNSTTSQGTFGDGGGELPYSAIEPSYDDTFLYNEIRVTAEGGSEQVAFDSTSITAYGRRTMPAKSGLPIGGGVSAADNEAASMTAWLLANYKDPHLRFTRLTIDPQANDASLWPQILLREIGDRITVKRRPPGGGNVISQDCFIEGIEHVAAGGPGTSWKTSWNLSPVDTLTYWILDSTTLSVLDSTTRLGY